MKQLSFVGPPAEPEAADDRRQLLWIIQRSLAERPSLGHLDGSTLREIAEAIVERLPPKPFATMVGAGGG